MTDPIRVLCVCTHNRTRSVLMAALLERHLADVGVGAVITSSGSVAVGHPATERTVRLLAERGMDAAGHRSSVLTAETVADADLILTAERSHVAGIVGRWPTAFARTVTLPEAVELARRVGPRGDSNVLDWLMSGGTDRRNALDYLDATEVGEIDDPTGQAPAVWARVFAQIDDLTRTLAKALA